MCNCIRLPADFTNYHYRYFDTVICNGCDTTFQIRRRLLVQPRGQKNFNKFTNNKNLVIHLWSSKIYITCPNCKENGWWIGELCQDSEDNTFPCNPLEGNELYV